MFCPKCGSKNDGSSRFCGTCGQPLMTQITSTPPPVLPPVRTKKKLKPWQKALIIVGSILAFLIIAFLIAYAVGFIRITPTSPASPASVTTEPETPSNSNPAPNQLTSSGPWFIYPTIRGIMACNKDGSGSVLVAPTSLMDFASTERDIPSGISSAGMLAHRKDSASGEGWDLEIITFPSLARDILTPLISSENLAKISNDDPTMIEAVIEQSPVQWSPDDRYLVFVAALDGPSSDLYVYDASAHQITRITSEPQEVARPLWTPDGGQIIYQVVESFGTGAGWSSGGVWSVKPDGSDNHLLFKSPYDTGPERFMGITLDNMALLKHFDQHGGGLFLANLNTGELQMVKAGEITSAAIDPYEGGYVFIDENGGLFYSPNPDTDFHRVDENDYSNGLVSWDDGYIGFFIQGDAQAVVGPYGDVSYPQGLPVLNTGWTCRLTSQSIECVLTGGENFQLSTGSDTAVYWIQDATGFFYIDGIQLFYASFLDHSANLIDQDVLPPNHEAHRPISKAAGWMR
jgi:hypothetical protein